MNIPDFVFTEWFWAMMQFIGVTASLIYLSRQVHVARTSTMLATMDSLTARWKSERMQDARRGLCDDFINSKGIKPATMTASAHDVANWLNEVGVLVERGVLDADLVWSRYSIDIENYWVLLQGAIVQYRRSADDQSWFRSVENLYPKMVRITWRLSREGWLKQRLARFGTMPAQDQGKLDASLSKFIDEERSLLRPRSAPAPAPVPAKVPETQPVTEILRQIAGWLDTTIAR